LAPTSTDAPPPKSALGLHHLPDVIEHLHQGAVREGHSHAELLMNPAELGRIRFDLITQGDQVQVTLSVERPETLDLLRANTEALRQEFRAAGLTADTLNFGQWSQRPPARDQSAAPADQAAPALLPQAIPAPYIKPPSTSALDLRL
jgi:flagellar hook-length control protein FliK